MGSKRKTPETRAGLGSETDSVQLIYDRSTSCTVMVMVEAAVPPTLLRRVQTTIGTARIGQDEGSARRTHDGCWSTARSPAESARINRAPVTKTTKSQNVIRYLCHVRIGRVYIYIG